MRRSVIFCLVIILLLTTLGLGGCQRASVMDPRIKQAIGTNSRASDAVDWLIANGDLVIPELMSRISGNNDARADEACQAIFAMGDYGRRSLLKYYSTLSPKGKERAIQTIAKENSKEAILQLMAISRQKDSFELAVQALRSMGDITLHYCAGQLHSDYYKDVVDLTIIQYGDEAVPLLIPAVNSNDPEKADRALNLLANIGEPAIVPLVKNTLERAEEPKDAALVSQVMLRNYPQQAAQAVIDTSTLGIGYPEVAASMLFELGEENMALVFGTRTENGTEKALAYLLDHYMGLIGSTKALQLALSNPGDAVVDGVKLALSAGGYVESAFTAIMLNMSDSDDPSSYLYTMCDRLIADPSYRAMAQAVIAQDATMMQTVVQSGLSTTQVGHAYSSAGTNEFMVQRLDGILNALGGEDRKYLLNALAKGSDNHLPDLVWQRYASGDAQLSMEAADAIVGSTSSGKHYPYYTMDFTPYTAKLISDLKSGNEIRRNTAHAMVDGVPTNNIHHGFFKALFDAKPSQSLFVILANHYSGKDALPVNLSMTSSGKEIAPKTVSLTIKAKVSDVSSKDYPNFESDAKSALNFLDVMQVQENADVALSFDIKLNTHYKLYSGMHSRSYLGAEGHGTLDARQNGSRVASSRGGSLILPPEDKPVGKGVYVYMADPKDAPLADAFMIAYIDALYRMWGEEVLFAMYNYDATNTLEAAKVLWTR